MTEDFVEIHCIGRDQPLPINHPELYFGFFGGTLSWQLMFLVIVGRLSEGHRGTAGRPVKE
jgi:hypothetical protein